MRVRLRLQQHHGTLAQGLDWCVDGQFAERPDPPAWIAPLVTGQLGFTPTTLSSGSLSDIKCGITFANGAGGKIRVTADTTGGSVVTTVDSGTCFGADSDACLPRQADGTGTGAVKVSSRQYTNNGATFLDVILCEPTAFTNGACSAEAALPGLPAQGG